MIGIYCIIPFCFASLGVLTGVSWAIGMARGFLGSLAMGVVGGIVGFFLGHLYLRMEHLGERISNRNWTLGCLFSVGMFIFFIGVMLVPPFLGVRKMLVRSRAQHAMEREAAEIADTDDVDLDPGHKVNFDVDSLDTNGLRGPPNVKVAVAYEFCIPDTAEARQEVAAIDPTVEFMAGSPGRIGCGTDECLCVGSTHQAEHREVLEGLAELPYVEKIDEAVFE
jgi:hypothetical protein